MTALAFWLVTDPSASEENPDTWVAALPPKARAELRWGQPPLLAALRPLLDGPLDPATIETACRAWARCMFSMRELLKSIVLGPFPYEALRRHTLEELPGLMSFLGSPAAQYAERSVRVNMAMWKSAEALYGSRDPSARDELATFLMAIDLDELTDRYLAIPSADIVRGSALLTAVWLAKHADAQGRGRELARLSLVKIVRGARASRALEGQFFDLDPDEPDHLRDDRLLGALVTLALEERPGALERLGIADPAPAPPLNPYQLLPASGLRRVIGRVAGVLFEPAILVLVTGEISWTSATPELAERALSLRGKDVQALIVGGLSPRLVRIDPAEVVVRADESTRTRAMLEDWDELLGRLAQ